jgi:hypothetical protein
VIYIKEIWLWTRERGIRRDSGGMMTATASKFRTSASSASGAFGSLRLIINLIMHHVSLAPWLTATAGIPTHLKGAYYMMRENSVLSDTFKLEGEIMKRNFITGRSPFHDILFEIILKWKFISFCVTLCDCNDIVTTTSRDHFQVVLLTSEFHYILRLPSCRRVASESLLRFRVNVQNLLKNITRLDHTNHPATDGRTQYR